MFALISGPKSKLRPDSAGNREAGSEGENVSEREMARRE